MTSQVMAARLPGGYDPVMQSMDATTTLGDLLRGWRQQRRLSQLELSLRAEVSTRHLSFLETGRASPSREMLLRLAEELEIPLRERNALLLVAGYAPVYPTTTLDAPSMQAARAAVELVLAGHEPNPALAVDRHWTLVTANRALTSLLDGIAPRLLEPPVNVLRASLHPDGIAPRIVNLGQWRRHLFARLQREIDLTRDPVLVALLAELRAFPMPAGRRNVERRLEDLRYGDLVIPLKLRAGEGVLSFMSTTTVFGTATDVTLSELTIESFFPADAATAAWLRQ